MGVQIAAAFDDFNNGEFNRGVEKLLPAFVRGTAATARLATEGATTTRDAEIKNAEFYTAGKLLGQSLGFQSTEVAEIQRKIFAAKRMISDIQKDRSKVLQDLDKALQKLENNPSDTNEEAVEKALLDVDRYNYKNGMLPITQETVKRSLEGRAKRRGAAFQGLMVGPKEAPFVIPLIEKTAPSE
jgi:hypothetical protein